jgi:hypothetical protein
VNAINTFSELVDVVRRLAGQKKFAAALREIERALPQLPLERAYVAMYARFRTGQAPAAIDLIAAESQ